MLNVLDGKSHDESIVQKTISMPECTMCPSSTTMTKFLQEKFKGTPDCLQHKNICYVTKSALFFSQSIYRHTDYHAQKLFHDRRKDLQSMTLYIVMTLKSNHEKPIFSLKKGGCFSKFTQQWLMYRNQIHTFQQPVTLNLVLTSMYKC